MQHAHTASSRHSRKSNLDAIECTRVQPAGFEIVSAVHVQIVRDISDCLQLRAPAVERSSGEVQWKRCSGRGAEVECGSGEEGRGGARRETRARAKLCEQAWRSPGRCRRSDRRGTRTRPATLRRPCLTPRSRPCLFRPVTHARAQAQPGSAAPCPISDTNVRREW